ncbi:MAG: hypothetical protein U0572_14385 [Phycisphaerales bacterium]
MSIASSVFAQGTPTPPAATPKPATPVQPAPSAQPADKPTEKPAATPASNMPTADELVKKHVAALGGEAAFLAVKSITTASTIDMTTAGIKGTMLTQMTEPNRFVSSMDLGAVGTVRQGFDGTTAWSIDPMQGPRLLAGKELDHLKRESDFRRDLSLLKDYTDVTVVGKTTFAGHDAYEVHAKGDPGEMTLYFDATSNLLCGMKTNVESGLGAVPVETVIAEYRSFDGPGGAIKVPSRSEIAMMNQGQKMVVVVDRVDFAPLDEKLFALPAEIAALVAAQSQPADKAPDAPKPDAPKPNAPAKPATPTKPEQPAQR